MYSPGSPSGFILRDNMLMSAHSLVGVHRMDRSHPRRRAAVDERDAEAVAQGTARMRGRTGGEERQPLVRVRWITCADRSRGGAHNIVRNWLWCLIVGEWVSERSAPFGVWGNHSLAVGREVRGRSTARAKGQDHSRARMILIPGALSCLSTAVVALHERTWTPVTSLHTCTLRPLDLCAVHVGGGAVASCRKAVHHLNGGPA